MSDLIEELDDLKIASEKELQEITEYLLDVRRRTGYGRIVIELRAGEIVEVEVAVKRRPKMEKKQRVSTFPPADG